MREIFSRLVPTFAGFEEARIVAEDRTVGWSVSAISKPNNPVGTGVHTDKRIATRIAIAEVIERSVFHSSAKEEHLKMGPCNAPDHLRICGRI